MSVRLNKFLAESLGVSRRKADDIIAAGKVTVNGETAILGARLDIPEDFDPKTAGSIDLFPKVCYNGKIVPFLQGYTYLALNKPVGYVCSRKKQEKFPTLYELLPKKYYDLKTVGRLDKDSSGLILLTNDGDFAFKMTHPKFVKTKVYEVELDQPLQPLHQQMIADFGVELPDGRSQLGLVRLEAGEGNIGADGSRRFWRVLMNEGRNRQIRRTFGALGYTVVQLHRTDFGPYHLDGLESGKFVEVKKI